MSERFEWSLEWAGTYVPLGHPDPRDFGPPAIECVGGPKDGELWPRTPAFCIHGRLDRIIQGTYTLRSDGVAERSEATNAETHFGGAGQEGRENG